MSPVWEVDIKVRSNKQVKSTKMSAESFINFWKELAANILTDLQVLLREITISIKSSTSSKKFKRQIPFPSLSFPFRVINWVPL